MFPKAFVGILLGLVLQLVQIVPAMGALVTSPAPAVPKMSASCCKGHCPCAGNRSEKERPAPLAPPVREVKAQVLTAFEDTTSSTLPCPCLDHVSCPAEAAGMRIPGYAGVALSVAYCRFLI